MACVAFSAGFLCCYIPITAKPTTRGFVVTEKVVAGERIELSQLSAYETDALPLGYPAIKFLNTFYNRYRKLPKFYNLV